jgi:SAM-dependent methyltransferase
VIHARLKAKVCAHYSNTIRLFGPTPFGVDWRNQAGQQLRFTQLLRICKLDAPFSINDFGCGYGALLGYIVEHHRMAAVEYRGIDLSPAMIVAARRLWSRRPRTSFVVGSSCRRRADYSVASGVFNVRLNEPLDRWESYIEQTLRDLCRSSRRGFAVNFMLPHDDALMEEELYRSPTRRWVTFCRRELGCIVRPLTGYGLGEFTLLARKRELRGPAAS